MLPTPATTRWSSSSALIGARLLASAAWNASSVEVVGQRLGSERREGRYDPGVLTGGHHRRATEPPGIAEEQGAAVVEDEPGPGRG
jgi:hypothetical protein